MIMLIVKLFAGLLAFLGVSKLAFHSKYGTSSAQANRKALKKFISDEEFHHQKIWGYTDENADEGALAVHHHFHIAMEKRMTAVKACHLNCGQDHACHQQCPRPWEKFQQKCTKMRPIMDCHKSCGKDHACHHRCPLPKCPEMAKKMKEAMKCHANCGKGQHSCHHACPRHPLKDLDHKCNALNNAQDCHRNCNSGDFNCHHECPKMVSIWRLDNQQHGDPLHGNHHQHTDEELHHQKMWGYNDEKHDGGHRDHFHSAMKKKMMGVKSCHMICGMDETCHKKCPKPWKAFEEKCMRNQTTDHMAHKCKVLHGVLSCHKACTPADCKCHQACPRMWRAWHFHGHHAGKDFRGNRQEHAEPELMSHQALEPEPKLNDDDGRDALRKKMVEVKTCHMSCGMDSICHEQCPKPWKPLEEKCMKMQPIVDCHRHCGRDHACHEQCPLPECPMMAKKVQESIACHAKCGKGEHQCHHACGRPMKEVSHKCDALSNILSCHKECMTPLCHRECPKMSSIWDFHGHHHGAHPYGHLNKYGMHEKKDDAPVMV